MNEIAAPFMYRSSVGSNPKTIIESVPNFSEGRNEETLSLLEAEVAKTLTVRCIDINRDADHNRSVFTLLGEPEPIQQCVLNLVRVAAERINLETQRGVHPRIGAADVIPFIPLRNASMDDCVRIAKETACLIAEKFNIPTYLYARAAERTDRTKLSQLRKGGYEHLRANIQFDPYFAPDFGPPQLGPSGASAVGARPILIAYNLFLASEDVTIAKSIARRIRESSGGLPGVQALGFLVDGRAQVSMNLTDYQRTSLKTVYRAVEEAAASMGTGIERGELIGCAPLEAFRGTTPDAVGLHDFRPEKILETHLNSEDWS